MADFPTLVRAVPHTLLLMLGEDTAYASKSAARLLDVASKAQDATPELAAVEEAGRVLDRLREELAAVGVVFLARCADLSPHDASVGPLFQRWAGHLADAILHTDEALRRIRAAKAYIAESGEACRAAEEVRLRRHGSQRRRARMIVGKRIARRACLQASGAGDEVRLLCRALVRLFFDAWKVCL